MKLDEALDRLKEWHKHEAAYLPVDDYPHECPSTRGSVSFRHWQSSEELADESAVPARIAHTGRIVNGMAEPFKAALSILARNLATGVSVWRSARLPEDADERAEVVAAALDAFAREI